jgi:hypothetical protein
MLWARGAVGIALHYDDLEMRVRADHHLVIREIGNAAN